MTIVDDRQMYANRGKFPDADDLLVADIEGVDEKLFITPLSYIVIVTRGHRGDEDALRWAVTTNAN